MREILFKAKRKDNGEWVEGDLIHEPYGEVIQHYEDGKRIKTVIDPDTICEYIGIKDKNDNRIWENDICIIHTYSIDENDGYFLLLHDNEEARFSLESEDLKIDFDHIYGYECEVVGNVFDNSELLKN